MDRGLMGAACLVLGNKPWLVGIANSLGKCPLFLPITSNIRRDINAMAVLPLLMYRMGRCLTAGRCLAHVDAPVLDGSGSVIFGPVIAAVAPSSQKRNSITECREEGHRPSSADAGSIG